MKKLNSNQVAKVRSLLIEYFCASEDLHGCRKLGLKDCQLQNVIQDYERIKAELAKYGIGADDF